MEYKVQGSGVEDWETLMLLYNSALKEMGTKVDILNDEFQHIHPRGVEPILLADEPGGKTSESIVRKLRKKGYEATIENMQKHVSDIAGIRIICSFTSDIYRIADMIRNQSDIKVLDTKDYILNTKESGYKSYHMIVTVPIFLSDSVYDTRIEIQIRTVAMDFWASLEHKMNYKFESNVPEHIKQELYDCAKMVSDLDDRMLKLNEEILKYAQENP